MQGPSIDCKYPDRTQSNHAKSEQKIRWVLVLTFVVMIFEIIFGHLTKSMALLADGYHMGTHFGALLLSYLVYYFARSKSLKSRLNFGTGKLLSLGGYTNAVLLFAIALWILAESVQSWLVPREIQYVEALWVAVIGLLVNLACAFILGHEGHSHSSQEHDHDHNHHDHSHAEHSHNHSHETKDHNFKSALAHVIADAVTSVLAILALLFGMWQGWSWLDPAMGVVGAVVIARWAYSLIKVTGLELLDGKIDGLLFEKIKKEFEDNRFDLLDFHIWNSGPNYYIGSAIVKNKTEFLNDGSNSIKKTLKDFKTHIQKQFPNVHFTIEMGE